MAKDYVQGEIRYLGQEFWAEERNHPDLLKCQSGAFVEATLRFSGCGTVAEYYEWLKNPNNNLEIRYWDKEPSLAERQRPWRVYTVHQNGKNLYMTEEEFETYKTKYKLNKAPIKEVSKYSFREIWESADSKICAIRSR